MLPEPSPIPLLERTQSRLRAGLMLWLTLGFAAVVTLTALQRSHIAMPLTLAVVAGLVVFMRLRSRVISAQLRRARELNDQVCLRCGAHLTSDQPPCPECGQAFTLAHTRAAWRTAREHIPEA